MREVDDDERFTYKGGGGLITPNVKMGKDTPLTSGLKFMSKRFLGRRAIAKSVKNAGKMIIQCIQPRAQDNPL